MKELKLKIGVLIFLLITFIAGCSDNLITNESAETEVVRSTDLSLSFEESVYSEKFRLNPGESKTFHYGNTNLILITNYNVSNCNISTRDLLIRSSNQADSASLPCSWKKQGNFAFEDLIIKNLSSEQKLISVNLRGYTINN